MSSVTSLFLLTLLCKDLPPGIVLQISILFARWEAVQFINWWKKLIMSLKLSWIFLTYISLSQQGFSHVTSTPSLPFLYSLPFWSRYKASVYFLPFFFQAVEGNIVYFIHLHVLVITWSVLYTPNKINEWRQQIYDPSHFTIILIWSKSNIY